MLFLDNGTYWYIHEDYNHKGIHNEKKSSGNAGPGVISCWRSNAAEIYNKDGNKVDFYGKMVGERIWSNTDDNNSENEDTSYARFGVKGETQITSELTGFGQFEYNLDASKPEGENQEKPV